MAGDNLIFDGTGVGNCTLDVAAAYGSISINAEYTGTVTQGALDFGCTDFSVSAGGFVAANDHTITCSGNWTPAAGTFTCETSTVIFTGAGSSSRCN